MMDNRMSMMDNRISMMDNRMSMMDNRISMMDNRISLNQINWQNRSRNRKKSKNNLFIYDL